MDELIRKKKINDLPSGGWKAALERDPVRFEKRAAAAFKMMGKNTVDDEKGELGKALEKFFPGKYRKGCMEAARDIGAALGDEEQAKSARWLIEPRVRRSSPANTPTNPPVRCSRAGRRPYSRVPSATSRGRHFHSFACM